jgi:acetyl esterase/lipase
MIIWLHPKNGLMQVLAWGPKLYVSALAPLLALLSSGLAALGIGRRDWLLTGAGVTAATVAVRHVAQVTAAHKANFDAVFGPNCLATISPELNARLRPYRWRPVYRRRPCGPLHLDVVYGINSDSGRPLTADLLQPPPSVPHTGLAMIFVHGGGWWFGGKNIGKFPYFQRLVSQGHVVMDINYTLAPHSTLLGMVKDVKQAVLWLKRQADQFDINPARIVLTGQSAGGQLSLLTAYTPNLPPLQPANAGGDTSVRGVVSYHGPPDLTALHYDIQRRFIRLAPGLLVNTVQRLYDNVYGYGDDLSGGIASVVGDTPANNPQLYRLLSPVTYVSADCPPTLLLQGNHDLLVDHTEVERFYALLRRAGAPAIYVPFSNCGHTFESILPRISPPAQTAAYYTERFLALLV